MNGRLFRDHIWIHPVILSLFLSLTVVVVTNLIFQRALPVEPKARMEIYHAVQMSEQAENELEILLKENPTNSELNTYYVDSYLDMLSGRELFRLEREMARYADLAAKPETADIGNYALGLLKAKRYGPMEALEHYKLLHNPNQKYVNNAIGDVYYQLGRVEEAEVYFWREIVMQGNVDKAVDNLARLYMKYDRLEGLTLLANDIRTAPFLSDSERRWLTLNQKNYKTYLHQVYIESLLKVRFEAWLSSVLITLVWLIYLRRTGLFLQEPFRVIVGGVLAGVLAALSTPLLADLLHLLLDGQIDTVLSDSAWYVVLKTGIPAEVIKFIPVIILAALSRQVNEPIDLMVYGSLVALGFATVDNVLQVDRFSGGILFANFLMNTVFQIFLTGGVCYLWAYAAHIRPLQMELVWPGRILTGAWILAGLIGTAALYGWYKTVFILSPNLSFTSILVVIFLAAIYGRMLRSALRHSFFNPSMASVQRLEIYSLVLCFGILFLTLGYLYDHFRFTTVVANYRLAGTVIGSFVVLVVVFMALMELGLKERNNNRSINSE